MTRSLTPFLIVLLAAPVLAADPARLDRQGDPLPDGAIVRYGSVRLRHPGGAGQVVFSRDGKLLVSVSPPVTLRPLNEMGFREWAIANMAAAGPSVAIVWDAATGKSLAQLAGKGLAAADFAPDGTLFVAGSDPACLAWNPATGKTRPLLTVKTKDEQRTGLAVAVSPDGRTVAVGCDKGLIVWFDPSSGRELGRLERRDQPAIQYLAWAADRRTLAVRAGNCDVFLVDTQLSRVTRSYSFAKDRLPDSLTVALSPDGSRLAVSTQEGNETRRVRLYETNSDEEAAGFSPPANVAYFLRFNATGDSLLGLCDEGKIVRWNAASGKEEFSAAVPAQGVAAISPDGKRLAVVHTSTLMYSLRDRIDALARPGTGFLRLYDATTGKRLLPEAPTQSLLSAGFADIQKAIATCDYAGQVGLWDRVTGQRRKVVASPWACLSPDGSRLAAWDDEHSVLRMVDTASDKELWRSAAPSRAGKLAFSPDGRFLAVLISQPGSVEIWDVALGRRRMTLQPSKETNFNDFLLSWSPDGRSLMTAERARRQITIQEETSFSSNSWGSSDDNGTGPAWVWDVTTGKPRWIGVIRLTLDQTQPLAWLAGRRVATIRDRLLRTYRIGSDESLSETLIPPGASAVAASPDGRWISVGFKSGAILVWDQVGARKRLAAGHAGAVTSLVFSADSSQLLSASEDGTALLWEVAALPAPAAAPAPAAPPWQPDRDWPALASMNGPDALAALDRLTHFPAESVRLLRERLKPAAAPDAKRLERLIADLGDAKFEVREKAQRELGNWGEQAEPILRPAAAKPASSETKKRIDSLLNALEAPAADPELIRQVRAVELLEQLATPEARELLTRLAGGDPAARLTKEAAAALNRLKRP